MPDNSAQNLPSSERVHTVNKAENVVRTACFSRIRPGSESGVATFHFMALCSMLCSLCYQPALGSEGEVLQITGSQTEHFWAYVE